MTRVRKTSLEVYAKIEQEGLLSKMRWLFYDTLFHHGPMTAREVFDHLGVPTNQSGRLTELRYQGAVEEIGERACNVTGHNVILWDVTDQLPKEMPELPKEADTIEAICPRHGRQTIESPPFDGLNLACGCQWLRRANGWELFEH